MKYLILILITLFTLNSNAQKSRFLGWYGNPKVGASFPENKKTGLFIGAEFALLTEHMVFAVDYCRSQELFVLFGGKSQFINQIGVMFGGHFTKGKFRLQGQIGIAPTFGEIKTRRLPSGWFSSNYEFKYFSTLGFISKIRFGWMPSRYVNIGLDLMGNFNNQQYVLAPAASVQIGILYKKGENTK